MEKKLCNYNIYHDVGFDIFMPGEAQTYVNKSLIQLEATLGICSSSTINLGYHVYIPCHFAWPILK